jgi:cell division protease FtsH
MTPERKSARDGPIDNQLYRAIALWLVLGLIFLLLFNLFSSTQKSRTPAYETGVAFSDFLDQVEAGTVTKVTIQGSYIHYRTVHGYYLRTYAPFDPDLVKILRAKRVKILVEPPEEPDPWWIDMFVYLFPMISGLAVWIWYNEKRISR